MKCIPTEILPSPLLSPHCHLSRGKFPGEFVNIYTGQVNIFYSSENAFLEKISNFIYFSFISEIKSSLAKHVFLAAFILNLRHKNKFIDFISILWEEAQWMIRSRVTKIRLMLGSDTASYHWDILLYISSDVNRIERIPSLITLHILKYLYVTQPLTLSVPLCSQSKALYPVPWLSVLCSTAGCTPNSVLNANLNCKINLSGNCINTLNWQGWPSLSMFEIIQRISSL